MRTILTVFRKEFFENLRDRRILMSALLFGPLLGPLMLMGVLQIITSQGEAVTDKPAAIAVIGALEAPGLIKHIESQNITIERVSLNEAQIRSAIQNRQYEVVLRIPTDFGERWSRSEPASVEMFADSSDQFGGQATGERVSRVISMYGRQIAQSRLLVRGIDPTISLPVVVQDIDVSTPTSRAAFALGILSYLVIFAMLFGGLYLAIDTTAGERERGSLESLLTVPAERSHLIYGKILATLAYMTISLMLTVAGCALTLQFTRLEEFGMTVSLDALTCLKIVAVSVPLALVGAGLLTVVASFTKSFREAQSYLSIAISIPTLPLAFVGILRLEPSTLLMATPSLGQHLLITQIVRGEPLMIENVLTSASVSVALGLLLCWIAGRLYDREAILG